MTITAPYNFVPLSTTVHEPEWAEAVSHDLPFQDGVSGSIKYTLTAKSPLLVGGRQIPATQDAPGEVHFYQLPNKTHAIPGSSIRGMLRSVVEIATTSRMANVDDRRYGLRDISGKYVSAAYTTKVRDKVRYGFMKMQPGGNITITPCNMVRLSHRQIEKEFGLSSFCFRAGESVADKYRKWESWAKVQGFPSLSLPFSLNGDTVSRLGAGTNTGYPVFTGQISDGSRDKPGSKFKNKYKDFIYYNPREEERFEVDERTWGDFLFIHSDPYANKSTESDAKKTEQPKLSWDNHWKQQFHNNKQVPVFYLQDQSLLRIGLAFMPKLAGDFSIHDMLGHSSKDHLDANIQDMATLIFGQVDNTDIGALRGRIACQPARQTSGESTQEHGPTILNSPKASFFPNYILQSTGDSAGTLSGASYATYLSSSGNERPQLRGWKRYPARPIEQVIVQPLTAEQISNTRLQVKLNSLPTGAAFTGNIHFHNLKPEELGALLWSISWGGDDNLHHSLGMGKSFGFGQVTVKLDELEVSPNDPQLAPTHDTEQAVNYMECFTRHMEKATQRKWASSNSLRALLGMANPNNVHHYKGGLQHMRLSTNGPNDFLQAKKDGQALPHPVLAEVALNKNSTPWVNETIARLAEEHKQKPEDVWRSKGLAQAWQEIDDAEVRAAALSEIKGYWQDHGWWDKPPGKSAKTAFNIYQEG